MTEEIFPHKFRAGIIDENAFNLYKHPISALKELISNGLDEQAHLPFKDQRIEILTHVGPDDDIWVVDWGNGILDFERFTYFGEGEKKTISDDPSLVIGKKGYGKVGPRSLSGAQPEPVLEWWSHTPEIKNEDGSIKYYESGMKVTLLKAGFKRVIMNSEVALDHHGCKVVIKNALYNKLPSPAKMISYLSRIYAIRISRGTKIILDGNVISKPEGFIKGEYDLITLDSGEILRGNAWRNDNVESDNVRLNVKYVLCDEYRIDNPCEIWINDNSLIPTTSRENVVNDTRLKEIKEKLQIYADEHYPRPVGPKVPEFEMKKQKDELWIRLLRYRNKLLSGDFSATGIEGQITGGQDAAAKWKLKDKVKLINTGGEDEGELIISIGLGKKGKKTKRRKGRKGPHPTIEDEGDHDVLIKESDNEQDREGLIEPKVNDEPGNFGLDKPMMWTEGLTNYWNTSYAYVRKACSAKTKEFLYLCAPLCAAAMINFDKEQFETIDADTWQKLHAQYIEYLLGGRKQ
jgi:hypothetical protein